MIIVFLLLLIKLLILFVFQASRPWRNTVLIFLAGMLERVYPLEKDYN